MLDRNERDKEKGKNNSRTCVFAGLSEMVSTPACTQCPHTYLVDNGDGDNSRSVVALRHHQLHVLEGSVKQDTKRVAMQAKHQVNR